MDKSIPDPPTCVLLHGILGSRKNWGSFAKRLAEEFPLWQFLLVDLRCHGDSASIKKSGPHTVSSAALDVLKLVGQLRLTPRVLVGHSFGGKVALSMVEQAAKPLARPVRVWVLDATPGKVRAGGDGEDHPGELISFLRNMPYQVPSKQEVVDSLVHQGFSLEVARWVVTNLRRNAQQNFSWIFDLNGIADMYESYEGTNLWEIVENVPRGVHINFLKAERSLHRWALEDLQRIHAAEELASDEGAGVQMHVLEDAGHWVHADNPDGLFRILSSTFRIETTLRGIRGAPFLYFATCTEPPRLILSSTNTVALLFSSLSPHRSPTVSSLLAACWVIGFRVCRSLVFSEVRPERDRARANKIATLLFSAMTYERLFSIDSLATTEGLSRSVSCNKFCTLLEDESLWTD
ncbi:hypothetical protein LUZ62_068284 [Rhynchospora pubera]|uniref:AB hydrolase-1 domain-containing protein n=1 Tax=Rhynchospora pubera TaxID=906938 RepID=A0AAV8CQI0_9POAL|nr:hypothetical protein LUZ62_068284 [Rhynchospora pubera]